MVSEGSYSPSNFTFFAWLQDGKLKPFVKSEPIPEVNNEPVKVVVRDTLRDLVLNSHKNGMSVSVKYLDKCSFF